MAHSLKKIILLLAVLAIPVGPIAARADSTADARAEAKKHYDRAMELNEDGQVAEAVIELKRCYELSPHHTVLYNLGQAYITLAKPVEAVAALQRYLDEGGKDIKPARRAEVEQEIARQKTRIATMDIGGLPDGAVVTIDGDEVGKAPLVAPLRVGVGKHVVAATAAGYEPGEAKIEIAGEDRKVVDLKLVPRPAQPFVAAAPVTSLAATPVPAPAAVPAAPTPPAAPEASPNVATSAQLTPGASLASAQGEADSWAESSKGSGVQIAGLVLAGVGAVGLAAGVILLRKEHDDWYGKACLMAGGMLLGAGLVTTLLSFIDDSPSKSAVIAPALGPNFAGLAMKGNW